MSTLKVAKLVARARIPTRKNPTDAGLDLYPLFEELIAPETWQLVHTGITVEIPDGFFGWITNKSSSNYLVGAGVIDQGYQGELIVKVFNVLNSPVFLVPSIAVAQLLIVPCNLPELQEVTAERIHLSLSPRNISGGIVDQLRP